MKIRQQTIVIPCPECEEDITFTTPPQLNQKVTCPECWADLKVISLDPVQVTWATDEFEEDFIVEMDADFEEDIFFEDDFEDEDDPEFEDEWEDEA
jgi:lysine biosynthesis protein LysW